MPPPPNEPSTISVSLPPPLPYKKKNRLTRSSVSSILPELSLSSLLARVDNLIEQRNVLDREGSLLNVSREDQGSLSGRRLGDGDGDLRSRGFRDVVLVSLFGGVLVLLGKLGFRDVGDSEGDGDAGKEVRCGKGRGLVVGWVEE